MSFDDLESGVSMSRQQGAVGFVGTIGVPLDVRLVNVDMYSMLRHDLRISPKMKFYCLAEISKLVCPVIKKT